MRQAILILVVLICCGACRGSGGVFTVPLGSLSGEFHISGPEEVLHGYAIGVVRSGSNQVERLHMCVVDEASEEHYGLPNWKERPISCEFAFNDLSLGSYQLVVCYFDSGMPEATVAWRSEEIELTTDQSAQVRDVEYWPIDEPRSFRITTDFLLNGTTPDRAVWYVFYGVRPADGEPRFLYMTLPWAAYEFGEVTYVNELRTRREGYHGVAAGDSIVGVYGVDLEAFRDGEAIEEYMVYGEHASPLTSSEFTGEVWIPADGWPLITVDFDHPTKYDVLAAQ